MSFILSETAVQIWGTVEQGTENYVPQQIYRHYKSVEEHELPDAKGETW